MDKPELYEEKIEPRLMQDSAKAEKARGVGDFESRRARLKEKYGQLTLASEKAWDDIQECTENSWFKLKTSFAKAIAQLEKSNEILSANSVGTQITIINTSSCLTPKGYRRLGMAHSACRDLARMY